MAHSPGLNRSLKTWLQLFRAPNLFTVPGDPLAGFLLVSAGGLSGRAFLAAGASLCFYSGGLLLNDLLDREEDRRERPERPLPSGAVRGRVVLGAAIALGLSGLGLCALAGVAALEAGFCIVLCVGSYDAGLKRLPLLGAAAMGLCRGFSVLLGAAAASGSIFGNRALPAALVTFFYIAAVTNLARRETRPGRASPAACWLPCLSLLAGGAVLVAGQRFREPLFVAAFLLACVATGWIAHRLRQPATPVPPAIGALIRALLFLQAAFCAASPGGRSGTICALVLLLLWPASRYAGRRFAGS